MHRSAPRQRTTQQQQQQQPLSLFDKEMILAGVKPTVRSKDNIIKTPTFQGVNVASHAKNRARTPPSFEFKTNHLHLKF
ncbi:hypothetical protein RRF57_005466 [Xylaria bambusicola]|uniref:Uncharacterized protein n=1 Tax=Xylaria bambusicola TaxID=326684 RepID=A0AAN7Z9A2_9PEZI